MKVSIIVSLIGTLATASYSPRKGAADPESISATCRDIHGDGSDDWLMWSCCKNPDGDWRRTRLDLAQCLKNDGGVLAPEWGGDASTACKGCRFEQDKFGCFCDLPGEDYAKMSYIPLVGSFSIVPSPLCLQSSCLRILGCFLEFVIFLSSCFHDYKPAQD